MPTPESTQMAREIAEQPDAVRRTLAALLPRREAIRDLARGRRRVLFAARGSSDNAAIYGRYLLEVHAGLSGGLASPSVATHYRSRLDLSRRPGRVGVPVGRDRGDRHHPGVGAWLRRRHDRGRQRGRLTAGGQRRPGPGDRGRCRARGAGDQDLPHPAGGDGGARVRAGAGPVRPRRGPRPGGRRGRPAAARPGRHRRRGDDAPRGRPRRGLRPGSPAWAPRSRPPSSWRRPACVPCAATPTPTCATGRSRW